MNQPIKIAVIGGTGKSGSYLLTQLLAQGFPCKVLLRNPESFQIKSSFIEIVKGDARHFEDVQALVKECQAVISTLGQPRGEPTIFSQASQHVIRAMQASGIKRYILCTGLNVDTPLDRKGPASLRATDWMKTHFPETTFDKQKEYELLLQSGLDWTLVRLPLIAQTDESRKMLVSLEDCPGDKISATDLAHFLIGQLSDETYVRQAPFIANV